MSRPLLVQSHIEEKEKSLCFRGTDWNVYRRNAIASGICSELTHWGWRGGDRGGRGLEGLIPELLPTPRPECTGRSMRQAEREAGIGADSSR